MPTQNAHKWITNGNRAIEYGATEFVWQISSGVLVGASANDAVRSLNNGSTLSNFGHIFSGNGYGVVFEGSDSTITNHVGAVIDGNFAGLLITDIVANVTNHGSILSSEGLGLFFGADSRLIEVTNTGEIWGKLAGILALFDGGKINNSGLIHSPDFGVSSGPSIGFTNTLINSGTIKAPKEAVSSDGGRLVFEDTGTVQGLVDFDASAKNVNDVVVNKGTITGTVSLGPGNDKFDGKGGTSGTVFGQAGNDKLSGGDKADDLRGGGGEDTLRGALGADDLRGGAGRDFFDYNSIAEAGKGSKRDEIFDFSHSQKDKIDLSDIDAKTGIGGNQKFTFIGTKAFSGEKGELRCKSGLIQGDVNGDGKADFEIKMNVSTLVANDFVL